MKISVEQSQKTGKGLFHFSRKVYLICAVTIVGFGILLAVSLFTGAVIGVKAARHGQASRILNTRFATEIDLFMQFSKALFVDRINIPLNYLRGTVATPQLDRLRIDIDFIDYQKIAYKRKQALNIGVLFSSADDYVPATLRLGDRQVKAKLRLKGDLSDHWRGDKWSFRIKVRGDDTLWGMKRFSLQHPRARGYIREWLGLEAMRREGLPAVRYRFVDVTINGTPKGIYALEEHFEKRLLEHANLREGPIVKFDEDLKWQERVYLQTDEQEYGSFSSSAIDGYSAITGHGSEFERAVGLLEAFRRGQLPTSTVFDGEKLAIFLALKDLFGAREVDWNDLRLYYNPLTSKLEPIGFDSHTGEKITKLFCAEGGIKSKKAKRVKQSDSMMRQVFADQAFFSLYINALQRVSAPAYLDAFFAGIAPTLEQQLHILYRDYPHIRVPQETLRQNQRFIAGLLEAPKLLHTYHRITRDGRIELDLGNIQSLPIEILGLSWPQGPMLTLDQDLVLPPKVHGLSVDYHTGTFRLPPGVETTAIPLDSLRLHHRILGTTLERTAPVFPWSYLSDAIAQGDWLTAPIDLEEFEFLQIDSQTRQIVIKPGRWHLEQNLVLPPGYLVVARAGVELDLRNGAKVFSHSALDWRGDEETPILIESSDATGQGIVVLQTEARSHLQHVVFNNLGTPREGGWQVPGTVTFYQAPVDMAHVQFRASRAEDALNIIRGDFDMDQVVFADSQADAFDGDFTRGRIAHSAFLDIGNDAIDVSGSAVEISDVTIDGVGDKGLSVGENSQVRAAQVRIAHAEIAVASKDLSELTLKTATIVNSRLGFTAFQKKPEFGPALIRVDGLTMTNTTKDFLIEKESVLRLDGQPVAVTEEFVEPQLYGAQFGKSSTPLP